MQLHKERAIGKPWPYQYCGKNKARTCHRTSVPSVLSKHISSEIMRIVTLTRSYMILSLLSWSLAYDALCVTQSYAVTE